MIHLDIDWVEVVRRVLKYLFEGLAVGLASMYLIKGAKLEDAVMVGVVAAATFSLLDMYAPQVSVGARLGSGLATGSSLVGGF
jgi:hypothetical protein